MKMPIIVARTPPMTRPAKGVHSRQQTSQGERHGALGRESQLFVSNQCFDPIFYEANGSSSACRRRQASQVETSTPPPTLTLSRSVFEAGSQSILGSMGCPTQMPRRMAEEWVEIPNAAPEFNLGLAGARPSERFNARGPEPSPNGGRGGI